MAKFTPPIFCVAPKGRQSPRAVTNTSRPEVACAKAGEVLRRLSVGDGFPSLLEIIRQYVAPPAADFLRVIGPHALPPVTEAARLRDQQMIQRIAINVAALIHVAVVERLVEFRAELVHRRENVFVALNPAYVV